MLAPNEMPDYFQKSLYLVPIIAVIKISIFIKLGLYRAILRYASFPYARTIFKAVTLGSLISFLVINYPIRGWPFGVFTMDWLITLFLVGSLRFFPRYYLETSRRAETGEEKKVLIYGAGDLGNAVVRNLLHPGSEYLPIGFIDDDPRKIGKKVHNLSIFGSRTDLPKIIKRNKIKEIIIAINTIAPDWLSGLVKECRNYHVFCRIAPKMSDMTSQDINIKNIDIADLLKRNPKDLDEKQIDLFLKRKKILITGAAGSIGTELVHQALRFKPKKLILVDYSEFSLYTLQENLNENIQNVKSFIKFKFILQDLRDGQAINQLIATEKPDIIFHAAAYKHVPLIESNPFSGILNNIQSTVNIANAADQNNVEKFVLISTDKAVRPTNIMGATKRICELYIQNLNLRSKTEFVAVRFGNVLGSSGSVVPKFLEQIRNNGPVTVTHPEVTRYFMLVQEAVQLVMQAASIGHGGEIFILNMGKPVNIREVAEDLIYLAGKEPYGDIDIQFTGLRPGEKLYEELLIGDTEKKTQYENITIGKMTFIDWDTLNANIKKLIDSTNLQDKMSVLINVKELVPEFNHMELPNEMGSKNILHLPLAVIPAARK
ncbi:MAG: hypothetical protein A3G32_04195 [Deltaproteobacteria bacterium RIFCSPLOWO2_12_FULL_40_28]|nr:MAG: hypothetical protein A3C45_08305 [Deltaproteobacteria bacterium RIFCSPHIGHO2_02_FULL_40_28]OGQ19571.1 MAG: hypothetical protein A3E27_07500 [Deltaproteobacteria bacterium RIFCSPHIGHO2_12_FULL_40_32]OGQ40848.1 MAG: hypothetical protein A3I69_02915 [Deltaproteobacteria bacterium RIFCSPLOWO2_02_FULL_40_36]OGQ53963.1 MAG: hypothetical protein A3G32_04195 [Deltaproteobacteria bacterium RIFCSPLOWO2_12_FULL_40_28]